MPIASIFSPSRVLLACPRRRPCAQPTGTTETCGDPSLVDSFRFETHLQEEALLYDSANLQIKCKARRSLESSAAFY